MERRAGMMERLGIGLVALLGALALTYALGAHRGEDAARQRVIATDVKRVDSLSKIRDTVSHTASVAVRRADSVRVRLVVVHDTVQLVDSTHLLIHEPPRDSTPAHDTVIAVPPEVTRRLTVDSLAIQTERDARLALMAQVRVDSTLIGAQAVTITDMRDAMHAEYMRGVKRGVAVTLTVGAVALAARFVLRR